MRPSRYAVGIGILAICALGLGADPAPKADKAPATEPAKRVIFIAPFGNETGQEQYDPAAAGIGDLIGVMLAQQERIVVVERQRLMQLTREQALALKGLTGQDLAVKAGKLLKADSVLIGRLYLVDGKTMVGAQVVDVDSSRVTAADQLECRPADLPEAALQLARSLAKKMELPLPDIDLAKIDKSPIASLHFAKALGHFYAGDMDAAVMHFMLTIDLDPDYVEAHYWAGMAYHRIHEEEHAVIEWEAFLERMPDSPLAPELQKLLKDAKAEVARSQHKRLVPDKKEGAK